MARFVPLVSTVFVLLLLLVATEMGPMVAEARTCESVKGTCFSKHNCYPICRDEGFQNGSCRWLLGLRGIPGSCACTSC
ncbi:hypothetical protein K1719_034105 [Acacia pycnantha]|nr:hypothetical protein K1719_034105 [Acacia pycnantha]